RSWVKLRDNFCHLVRSATAARRELRRRHGQEPFTSWLSRNLPEGCMDSVIAGQRGQADREGPRKRHDLAGGLPCLPIVVVIFPESRASSSSRRAFSAATSFLTRSISSRSSRSAPVRTARWQPRLTNVISEAMCPVERANR